MLQSFLDGRLYGTRSGDGRPRLLALHGWQRTAADFDRVLGPRPDLGGDTGALDAIAVDLPGFGASPPPSDGWGTRQYAAFLLPLLEEFRQPPIVLGHSFGGRVAIQLAADHPERVGALLLTGVPLIRPSDGRVRPPLPFRLIRRAAALHLVSEARLEAARRRYGSRDYREAQGVLRAVLVETLRERYEEQIDAIRHHVEMVWGANDTAAPAALAKIARDRFADARLEVVPGVGHLVPTEAPDALRAAALRLLQ